ncbi:MAG: class I SAM-dependent methyltransferase [Candidatus Bathyarchaeota archaeon]|nr:class I SAM-dependent methyltransferase [Candidatus Bathyarchaeota archaeon]
MKTSIRSMYNRLADFLTENLDFHQISVILEAGCGRGQLTIPFAKKAIKILAEFKIIAFDVSAGPYEGALDDLKESVLKERLEKFIVTVNGDVRNMKAIDDESIDLIISNELFCDLDREGLEKALNEFHRILKTDGQMAHGELNPVPENPAQKLFIEADSHSLETLTSEYEWFSPFSDEVVALMHKLGFKNTMVKYFETDVHLSFNDAIKQLKKWNIKPVIIEKHIDELKKYGLEYPIEHVIFCKK